MVAGQATITDAAEQSAEVVAETTASEEKSSKRRREEAAGAGQDGENAKRKKAKVPSA
jgi:hypothetical protein